jgi:hypothetical protein
MWRGPTSNAASTVAASYDHAAMAAPPLALAAHHGGRGCLQFSEQAADCLEELGAAHVVGVRARKVSIRHHLSGDSAGRRRRPPSRSSHR